jgi:hypothetical protein
MNRCQPPPLACIGLPHKLNTKRSKHLPPKGLFISPTTRNQLQTASDIWHHHDPSQPNLSRLFSCGVQWSGAAADKAAKGGYQGGIRVRLTMSASGLQCLLKAAFDDPELEARLKAPDADVVSIGAAAGFTITAEEFANALQAWENWRITSIHDTED